MSSDKQTNMAMFEILSRVLNIIQIIDVILRHVQDYKSIKDVLEDAKTRANKISRVFFKVCSMPDVNRVLSDFFEETAEELRSICEKLRYIQDKLANGTTARSLLASPGTLALLKNIVHKLPAKEQNVKLMAITLKLDTCQRPCEYGMPEAFSRALSEPNILSDVLYSARLVFNHICRKQVSNSENTTFNSRHREEIWIDENDTLDELPLILP